MSIGGPVSLAENHAVDALVDLVCEPTYIITEYKMIIKAAYICMHAFTIYI